MFQALQDRLSEALRAIRGKAKLSEANMRDGLKLVQEALLEADVSYPVVQRFISDVSADALGERVLKSLDPTTQLIGLVHDKLIDLMGPVDHSLHLRPTTTVIMMCGLQGSGKTTTVGKLGKMLKEQGKKPLFVAADLQRPAAIEQLHVLGQQLLIPVYSESGQSDPVAVCQAAVKKARAELIDVVVLDTAGRLHIDAELMDQLKRIDLRVEPDQVYLVVDGMTGQDAVNSAKAFNEALELDGVIMTKLDGDARGGALLSVKAVTGVPVKFLGTGEHLDALEEFHPERMAGRILGQGDLMSLVEIAHKKLDEEEMRLQQERLAAGRYTLTDFRKMYDQMRKLGSLSKLLGMIPGMGHLKDMLQGVDLEKDMKRFFAMIDSMTPFERDNPKQIDQSRRRRIALGSGTEPHEVNELIKQFDGMAGMMKMMNGKGMGGGDRMAALQQLQRQGMMNPGGMFSAPKGDTGKRLTAEERKKLQKQREKELRRKNREKRK
ncbi:MAG: signal recognition particle protein [Pirellulales bacterium]|nr:signal recognition particle protein [Pirellulales bacterium]